MPESSSGPRAPEGGDHRDTAQDGDILEARWFEIDRFLPADLRLRFLQWARHHAADFEVGKVVDDGDVDHGHDQGDDPDQYRTNRANYNFRATPEAQELVDRVVGQLPAILTGLGMPPFALGQVETQLTASNDGHFFKPHQDQGDDPRIANRELTFVYYFHRLPQAYSGGELRLFDSCMFGGVPHMIDDQHHDLPPRDNALLVFPSRAFHEVLPVNCPTKAFADSRFAVTGWVGRRTEERLASR